MVSHELDYIRIKLKKRIETKHNSQLFIINFIDIKMDCELKEIKRQWSLWINDQRGNNNDNDDNCNGLFVFINILGKRFFSIKLGQKPKIESKTNFNRFSKDFSTVFQLHSIQTAIQYCEICAIVRTLRAIP